MRNFNFYEFGKERAKLTVKTGGPTPAGWLYPLAGDWLSLFDTIYAKDTGYPTKQEGDSFSQGYYDGLKETE